jgi:hypothetical protein
MKSFAMLNDLELVLRLRLKRSIMKSFAMLNDLELVLCLYHRLALIVCLLLCIRIIFLKCMHFQ